MNNGINRLLKRRRPVRLRSDFADGHTFYTGTFQKPGFFRKAGLLPNGCDHAVIPLGQRPAEMPADKTRRSGDEDSPHAASLDVGNGGWLGSTEGSPQTSQHWGLRSEDSAPTPATPPKGEHRNPKR